MKYVYGILISFIFCTGVFAQVTPYLQIQIYTSQLQPQCNLADAVTGGDTIYMHSGLDWKIPQPQVLDSIWETIVGVWGANDGIGEMTHLGSATSDTFSITFNIIDYYTTLADPPGLNEGEVGLGPMNPDSTPYNIGMVFRIGTCPDVDAMGKPSCPEYDEGKDENCANIYVLDLPYPNSDSTLTVYDSGLQPFTAVSAKYVQGPSTGIQETNKTITSLSVYPSPFTSELRLNFTLVGPSKPQVEIFNVLGQKITDLSSQVVAGRNSLTWNGTDKGGNTVPAGIYFVQMNNGGQVYSSKIIKQ